MDIEKEFKELLDINDGLREENKNIKERADNKQSELRKEMKHLFNKLCDLQEENKLLKMSLEEKDENCYSLANENNELKTINSNLEDELYAWKSMFKNLRKNNPKLYKEAKNYMAFENMEDENIVKDENTYRELEL